MAVEMIRDTLRMTNIKENPQLQVFIEEDFLVPDVKPDMIRIISINGTAKLGEKENFGGRLRVGGDLNLSVLYVPSTAGEEFPLEVMETKTTFRHDEELAEAGTELDIIPKIEHLEYSVVNERKLRVKAILSMNIKEYESVEKNIFSGFREEDLEILKETLHFTDVVERKKDYIEVKDEVRIREGMPEIGRILKWNFSAGETYRQISGEKAIISGAIYYNILYISDELDPVPVFFQGRTDFTQFIRLEDGQNLEGSNVVMTVEDVKVTPKMDEDDNITILDIMVGIVTRLDTLRERTAVLVEDLYHSKKVVDIEREEIECSLYRGSGSSEASIRETISIPAGAEPIFEVIYITGEAFTAGGQIEKGRAIIEGVLEAQMLYRSGEEDGGGVRSFMEEIPFRVMVEVADLEPGMEIKADFFVKRLGFEKISDRQVEVYGDIVVTVTAQQRQNCVFVKSASVYDDLQVKNENEARLVLYIARQGDSMWNIGKRHKTAASDIRLVNSMEEGEEPVPGRRMLIWC